MRPARILSASCLVPVFLLTIIFFGPIGAQEQEGDQELKTLSLEDYSQWSSIGQVQISTDGRWMTYAYAPNEGDSRFFVRDLNRLDAVPSDTILNGSGAVFSGDSRWLAFLTTPPEDEAERLREQRNPVPRTLHIKDLSTGEKTEVENVSSFTFSDNSLWLAIGKSHQAAGGGGGRGGQGGNDGDRARGADLLLRDLTDGTLTNLGNVAEHAFNEAGTQLAYLVDADGKAGNGLYLMELSGKRITPLNTGEALYQGMNWDEDGTRLAVLRGAKPEGFVQRENVVLGFTDVGDRNTPFTYDPSEDSAFPEGHVISEFYGPRWSDDGARIFIGIKEQWEEVEENDDPRANVDVWHWKDLREQSVQMVRAGGDRRATYLSAVNIDGSRFIRLADDDFQRVQLTGDGRWAIGFDDSPYRLQPDFSRNRNDVYRIDPADGEKTLIAETLINSMGTSPDSRWFLFWQNQRVQAFELNSGEIVDLTAGAGGVDFENKEFDRPVEKPTYGVGGWSNDGDWIFLNTRFDVWQVSLDGEDSRSLTAGAGERDQIRYRIQDLNSEDDGIDTSEPVILSAYGEWTKKTGYFRARSNGAPEELIWEDAMIGAGGFRSPGVQKATDTDRLIFTRQTFVDFPDWWLTDSRFRNPRRITEANPQQAEYAWGRRVLVDYTDERGHRLQATLSLPAGYTPGQQYPMISYFYEKNSQRHHQYSMPVYDDRPHMSTYASNGVMILMPDIIFDEGLPGSSALDDVVSSARAAIDQGYADPDRICIQGHSWGGYETSFIVTQTDMFACVVTGAPLTNLVSMYNINYKGSGSPNGPILEWSQGRMNTSPYHDFDLYVSQSPLHHVRNIDTPFMILHGTADGAVDWNQGLEFYNAARRFGKEVILLSYPDEPHHLGREENQKDFQTRMRQYFDHYLKGTPMPRWMADGVPFLEKDRIGPRDGVGEG